jgi:alpha-amylase/alpha-mannosidase (GH57 family)
MKRYICIHGHFYQPPRENPWLERIEAQESAYPYHDWNERVNAECYAPIAVSRIVDGNGRIIRIVNNYEKINFDFGPTLLSWIEWHSPHIYRKIIEADRLSMENRSGHGNAMAQAYNHMIMPLANRQDKVTQIVWGIQDFRKRFGRQPEGMWLPEAAVDTETLEIMNEHGIRFTVLSPGQARSVRPVGREEWTDVSGSSIDTTIPYLFRLPSGAEMHIIFYDGGISHDVSFGDLLNSGESFANRLFEALKSSGDHSPIVNIATDGETYGHHHKFGEMALAYAVDNIESDPDVRLCNYAEYLSLNNPAHEVQIIENTSWSCAHGIERWRSDCGCTTGGHPEWSQGWRAPLRESLDRLRERLAGIYAEHASGLLKDPWGARNNYIDVILERTNTNRDIFLRNHAVKLLNSVERVTAFKLLEMQRNAMLMYTSCGWFFEDLSGIETVQILRYAARAIELAGEVSGQWFEDKFLEKLAEARSNIEELGNGADIYKRSVKTSRADLKRATVHMAISSFFEEYPENTEVYCYKVKTEDYQKLRHEDTEIAIGRLCVTSLITEESKTLVFAALQLGEYDYNCAVTDYTDGREYKKIKKEILSGFSRGDLAGILKNTQSFFGPERYTIKDLFKDEQQRLLDVIIKDNVEDIEKNFEGVYEKNSFLMGMLEEFGHRIPGVLMMATEIALKREIQQAIQSRRVDTERVGFLLREMKMWHIRLDLKWLEMILRRRLEEAMRRFSEAPDFEHLERVNELLTVVFFMPVQVNLWTAQNIYYDMLMSVYPDMLKCEDSGEKDVRAKDIREWIDGFLHLGQRLFFNIEEITRF